MSNSRLVVVSNRLPLNLARESEQWVVKPSSGGLATAMEPILKKTGGVWIGWAGDDGTLDPTERNRLLEQSSSDFAYVPVDFPAGAGSAFYEGYPNQTIWPLFHFFPSRMNYVPQSWRHYMDGNRYFAAKVEEKKQDGDLIWIHDYHLMLLPDLIRARDADARIGFFLHIPFPSSELFAMLPHAEEVLRGLLGADLIAFHTHRHLHHFRSALLRIAGIESMIDRVEHLGRTVRLEALPIGIAPEGFSDLLSHDPETVARLAELEATYKNQQVIVAVDRLDYSKGIPERLHAFRALLRSAPERKGKAVLIQVAVPSREGIGEYKSLSSEINELVGEINGEFGTPDWNPIVFLRHSIEKSVLASLYAVADVAWVTPLRDGMNLVAKEYCASKQGRRGVLVLSQFAGAAAEMGEALLVNPYDEEQVVAAIGKALDMADAERDARMARLRERIVRNNVFKWAENFLETLRSVEQTKPGIQQPIDVPAIKSAFKSAEARLLILDYDGTLVGIKEDPSTTAPSAELIATLTKLANDQRNLVAIVSGRSVPDLERWLGKVPKLLLSAEHGACIRKPSSPGWEQLMPAQSDLEWKSSIRSVLQHFVDRAPGSFIEEKEYSLVWHYRRVEPEFGNWLAGELTALLEGLLADTDARPVRGRKIVEVRPLWANKGALTSYLVSNCPEAQFQLGAGDDTTDEDMFEKMAADAVTIHVGDGHSRAKYRLRDPAAVLRLLDALLLGQSE